MALNPIPKVSLGKRISPRVDPVTKHALALYAHDEDLSESKVVRKLIREGIPQAYFVRARRLAGLAKAPRKRTP